MVLKEAGLTADEIALSLGYPVEAVTIVLARHTEVESAQPSDSREKIDKALTRLEDSAISTIADAVSGAELPPTQLKAALYVLNQRQGLMKPKESNNTLNIFSTDVFNKIAEKVRERRHEIERRSVDVESCTVRAA